MTTPFKTTNTIFNYFKKKKITILNPTPQWSTKIPYIIRDIIQCLPNPRVEDESQLRTHLVQLALDLNDIGDNRLTMEHKYVLYYLLSDDKVKRSFTELEGFRVNVTFEDAGKNDDVMEGRHLEDEKVTENSSENDDFKKNEVKEESVSDANKKSKIKQEDSSKDTKKTKVKKEDSKNDNKDNLKRGKASNSFEIDPETEKLWILANKVDKKSIEYKKWKKSGMSEENALFYQVSKVDKNETKYRTWYSKRKKRMI